MKRFIMLALVLTVLANSAFSNSTDAINNKVLASFTRTFAHAEDVEWEPVKNLYRAKFKLHGQVIFAYYNSEGENVAISRNIRIAQLPLNLSTALQDGFKVQWLTGLFEVSTNGTTQYYAVVENATHKTILKAEGSSGWMVFKKDKKQE